MRIKPKEEVNYKVKYMETLGYGDVSRYDVDKIDVLIDTDSLFDNLVAIEFKDDNTSDARDMLSQIAMTVYKAYYIDKTLKRMPMYLAGINREMAYFYKLDGTRFLFTYNAPYWNECMKGKGIRPSNLTEQTKDEIWNFIKDDIKTFNAKDIEQVKEYIKHSVENDLINGKIQIDKINFPLVFDIWKWFIGDHLQNKMGMTLEKLGIDYSLLFINDFLRYSNDITKRD
ncbi:MAG: hypothetical protein Ta2D_08730 [Rickettsiales bacterium]|nr:MAG: hypothetical protein Ta2D_08730 [Rickettsiales bacterium]